MNKSNPREFTGQLARPPWCYRQWMLAGNRALFFDRLVNDYGDFLYYRGLFNFYLVNHPALVKQVLQQTHKSFDKRSVIYDRFRAAFGDGLVVSEGDKWKRQRALMQPMFGQQAVMRYFKIMADATIQLVHRWRSRCRDKAVFDIADSMNEITLEVAGRALFHDGFRDASDQIAHWTHVINHYSSKPPLPIIRSFWFPSTLNWRLKRTLTEFNAFLQQMIDDRRDSGSRNDLLSILLQATDEETGDPMTDQEIKEEVLGMIIGGHETSSAALTWIWFELDRNPAAREKLVNEIDSVIGKRPLEIDDLEKLTYTRMVIEETLRLHPPFWFENRNVKQPVELGGVELERGDLVLFSRYSLHRHADFWENPEEFNPQRFMPDEEENSRNSYASIPFGGGPRVCIGMHFAMQELLVILATVCRHYRVIVDEQDRHSMSAMLTMTPANGVKVRLEHR